MNKETYEKATELVDAIEYTETNIEKVETMLENFDSWYTSITVECDTGSGSVPISIVGQHVLPELREALQKALKRFKQELKENKEKLEDL